MFWLAYGTRIAPIIDPPLNWRATVDDPSETAQSIAHKTTILLMRTPLWHLVALGLQQNLSRFLDSGEQRSAGLRLSNPDATGLQLELTRQQLQPGCN
jgi:hypothetical protein